MPVNQQDVNAETKLLMHRIIARRLRRALEVLERVRARFASLNGQVPTCFLEWWEVLGPKPAAVVRAITEHSVRMEPRRSASPFDLPEFMDPSLRRRIWSKARRRLAVQVDRPYRAQVR